MAKYIFQRIIAMFVTLFIIVTISFMVVRLMPGSVYEDPDLSPAVIEALEKRAHLHEPLLVQYGYFLKGIALEGDWGTSVKMQPGVPAFEVIRSKIPISLFMNVVSLVLSLPIGIIAGTLAALKRNKLPDHIISFLVIICISVPNFVFASLLQYFFAYKFKLFPIIYNPTTTSFWQKFHSLFLPILSLSFWPLATVTRYLRGELIEMLSSEFMLLAKTKGLSHTQATIRHAFRNAFLPLANIVIPMFTSILGGSLVIEQIFSIPGIGGVMVDSISSRDYPLTIAVLIFYSVISLATVLIVDISYGIIDPRIRLGGTK